MFTVTNNLTQPIPVGEKVLAAGDQLEVEATDKKLRGLAERGFVSITKIETEIIPPTDAEVKNNKEKK